MEDAPQTYVHQDRPLNKTVEVQDRSPDEVEAHLERMDTKPEEVGSSRAQPKQMNLVSPLQIIRQGCIGYDNGAALNGADEEYFDDIRAQAPPEGHSLPRISSTRLKPSKKGKDRSQPGPARS